MLSSTEGRTFGANANAPNTFAYTGQRIDPESGLYYYRARHYSPLLGRFLQPDPIGYQGGINLYAYVGNDPLNATDPNGQVADAITNSDFYNQTVLQAEKDIGDLLSHPDEIPGAMASVLPGLGPIAELPQVFTSTFNSIAGASALLNSLPAPETNLAPDYNLTQTVQNNALRWVGKSRSWASGRDGFADWVQGNQSVLTGTSSA